MLGRENSDQAKGIDFPGYQKEYPKDAKLIDLVAHDEIKLGDKSFLETVISRRSVRRFSQNPLTLEQLSYLLLSTQGILNPQRPQFRTAPSGGARHGLETYIYVQRTENLKPGLYRYIPLEHKLLWLGTKENAQMITALNNQDFSPAVTFLWTVIPYRIAWRYTIAAEKLALLDAGHVCQNLYLACEAAGMGTCAIGAYLQKEMDEFLEVDGKKEFAVYAAVVGVANEK